MRGRFRIELGMHTAIYVPGYLEYADPRIHVELAQAAEDAGWDGYFIWDHIAMGPKLPVCEAFVTLGAIATATERIRIGPMITPIARRRPSKLAKEVTTLDHLSGGRVILGIGLGAPDDMDFGNFGDSPSLKERGEQTDEGLEVLQGLLGDAPVEFEGKHYTVHAPPLRPKPVQPRIPIWLAGVWPARKPFRRAARFDGCFPTQVPEITQDMDSEGDLFDFPRMWLPATAYRDISDYLAQERGNPEEPFDLVATGSTAGVDRASAAAMLAEYRESGVTWWCEWIRGIPGNLEKTRELIRRGPPAAS